MPTEIGRAEVKRLVADGAQLIDVMPRKRYEEAHLPGALHIPLTSLSREPIRQLDRNRPVIVDGYDTQWYMGPRAAWRLDGIGFERVLDYVAGKHDWFANGLPREDQRAGIPHAGDVANRKVPTCKPTQAVGQARVRVRATTSDVCVVVTDQHVVFGLRRTRALNADAPVDTVIDPGPSTFRPSATVDEMATYFREHELDSALIKTSGGVLIGLPRRADTWSISGDHRFRSRVGDCAARGLP